MKPSDRPLRIGLVGAECTGKTTLACALADALPGLWVPELLREFCDRHGRTPGRDEQSALLREQIAREARVFEQARREGLGFVLCDSTPLVTALYSVEIFGDASLIAQALEHQRGYAATLLAATDLPWQADGIQRDGPLARERFHRRLSRTLREQRIAFARIAGEPAHRLATALDAVHAAAALPAARLRRAGARR